MCRWGETKKIRVKILPGLSHSGKEYWKDAEIDSCIAPLVECLQNKGIDMISSCCGHGVKPGIIELASGDIIVIKKDKK